MKLRFFIKDGKNSKLGQKSHVWDWRIQKLIWKPHRCTFSGAALFLPIPGSNKYAFVYRDLKHLFCPSSDFQKRPRLVIFQAAKVRAGWTRPQHGAERSQMWRNITITKPVRALSQAPTQIRFVVSDPHNPRLCSSPVPQGTLKKAEQWGLILWPRFPRLLFRWGGFSKQLRWLPEALAEGRLSTHKARRVVFWCNRASSTQPFSTWTAVCFKKDSERREAFRGRSVFWHHPRGSNRDVFVAQLLPRAATEIVMVPEGP